MSKRNESIGTVECPAKGCTESCAVFRFRERGETPTSVANRRFAGKLYARCPRHGQFGGSAGDDAMQEYIETHAKKLTAGGSPQASTPAPAPKAAAPARRSPAPPARAPVAVSPAPPAQPPAKKRSGFGFFEFEGDE